MGNLLCAGGVRLLKSRIFRLLVAAEAVWGSFLAWLICRFGNVNENLGLSVYMPMTYLCVAAAVFCGFYIGTDYSDGTLRNKISVGRTRESVYLSNLFICCLAGLAVLITHLCAFFAAGYLFMGRVFIPHSFAMGLVCAFATTVGSASLFTMTSMLCSKTASAAVSNILVSMAMIAFGVIAYMKYSEPEFLPGGAENFRYVGGAARSVLGFFEAVLPTSSMLETILGTPSGCSRVIICSLSAAAVFTGVGMAAFKRKNIF